jgi:hypothetical protein
MRASVLAGLVLVGLAALLHVSTTLPVNVTAPGAVPPMAPSPSADVATPDVASSLTVRAPHVVFLLYGLKVA